MFEKKKTALDPVRPPAMSIMLDELQADHEQALAAAHEAFERAQAAARKKFAISISELRKRLADAKDAIG